MAGECKIRVGVRVLWGADGGCWGRSPIHPPPGTLPALNMSSARNGRVVWSERDRESGIEEIGLSLSLCVLGPWYCTR